MDCCVICLDSNCHPFSRITTQSTEWSKKQIQRVIEKHLWWWYMKPQPEGCVRWICRHCWQEISSFHNFYLKVEMVHKQYQPLIAYTLAEKNVCDTLVKYTIENVNDNTCSSSNLIFLKEQYQKQTIKQEIPDHEEKRKETTFKSYIKTELINDEYETNEQNFLQVTSVKEELQYNNSHNDDPINIDGDTGNSGYIEVPEEEGGVEETAPRANIGKLKKNDVIDFFEEFQFRLECVICNISQSTFASLSSHYKDQHNMRGFAMCCGIKFFRRHLLIDHLSVHKDPNFFKCHKCNRVYSARDNLNYHVRKNRCKPKYGCKQCGKQFLKQKNFVRHKLTHFKPNEKIFNCKTCKKFFESKVLLQKHEEYSHHRNCEKTCNFCGKIFSQNCALQRHLRHNCSVMVATNLDKTKNMELNNGNITTHDIVKGGEYISNVKSEPSVLSRTKQVEYITTNEDMVKAKSEHTSIQIIDNDNLAKKPEYNEHSDSEDNSNDNGEDNSSGKAFKNMYAPSVSDDFFRDMQYVMECSICYIILPDFQSLISHYRFEHNTVGYGMCCGKKYYRRGVLADHLKLHKNPDLFKCQFCNRKFATCRGLEQHIDVCAKKLQECK